MCLEREGAPIWVCAKYDRQELENRHMSNVPMYLKTFEESRITTINPTPVAVVVMAQGLVKKSKAAAPKK